MQPRSDLPAVRALPRIWVAYLCYQLHTDQRGLDCTLTCRPDGHAFQFGRHPRAIPKKGAPQVFERIAKQGHWPNINSYAENDLDGRFNLFERVESHLPGSQHWLFADLKRAAQRQPHDVCSIQDAIHRLLTRFGFDRLDPLVSLYLNWMALDAEDDLTDRMYIPMYYAHWDWLAHSSEPAHVTLLTLFCQEWRCYESHAPFELLAYCRESWTRFLRRPELTSDLYIKRCAINACREILAFIELEYRVTRSAPTQPHHRHCPLCPIWAPDPSAKEAEERVRNFLYRHEREQWDHRAADRRGPLLPKPMKRALPSDVQSDLATIWDNIATASARWSTAPL